MLEACLALIPQEDDGRWVPEQAAAEDAGAAVAFAIRCRQSGTPQDAAWCARRAYEAADHHVVNQEGVDTTHPAAEERVVAHPVVQAELARQRRDLDDVTDAVRVDLHRVALRLRARAAAEAPAFFVAATAG